MYTKKTACLVVLLAVITVGFVRRLQNVVLEIFFPDGVVEVVEIVFPDNVPPPENLQQIVQDGVDADTEVLMTLQEEVDNLNTGVAPIDDDLAGVAQGMADVSQSGALGEGELVAFGDLLNFADCTITVGGQTAAINADGTFSVANISAADRYGAGGPGTPPDFLSDEYVRALVVCRLENKTRFAYSERFRFRQGQRFLIENLTVTDQAPPFPEAIRIVGNDLVVEVDIPLPLTVIGTLVDGSETNVSMGTAGTVYGASNLAIASVDANGVVLGKAAGIVLITATNEGATAVKRITVTAQLLQTTIEGLVQKEDGSAAQGAVVEFDFGTPEVTDADGFFSSVLFLPVEQTTVRAIATLTEGDQVFRGSSGDLPVVPDGITDAGMIVLRLENRLYGGVGAGSTLNPGALLSVDQATGMGTLIGDVVTPGGLTGLAFNSTGELYGSTIRGAGSSSSLVLIDRATGTAIAPIVQIRNGSTPISIGDLAFQPSTDVLFGVRSNADGANLGGLLYTISTANGAATLVGNTMAGAGGGIAFTPDGRLFQTAYNNNGDFPSLNEIDPASAGRITTLPIGGYFDGLAIRSSDSTLFVSDSLGGIYVLDPVGGKSTFLGSTGAGNTSDLAFGP